MTHSTSDPYSVSVYPHFDEDAPAGTCHLPSLGFPLWVCVGLSGAVMGMIAGPIGMIVGGVLAFGSAAVIVPLSILLVGLIRGTSITRAGMIVVGGGCGALCGGVSTVTLFGAAGGALVFAAIAGVVGGLGGILAGIFTGRASTEPAAGDSRWN